jgi:phosphoglucomutase
MPVHPDAGRPGAPERRASVQKLVADYYVIAPDPSEPRQRVAFGTSGHRGRAGEGSFNDAHVAAIVAAIAEQRRSAGIDGPLFLGADTHALSEPAFRTALEVLAAHEVDVVVDPELAPLPTPVVSHAILRHEATRRRKADGIVITPSHNPPEDGGFKYNPPHGGPADAEATAAIERRANELLEDGRAPPRPLRARARRRHHHRATSSALRRRPPQVSTSTPCAAGLRSASTRWGCASLATWHRVVEPTARPHVITNDDRPPPSRSCRSTTTASDPDGLQLAPRHGEPAAPARIASTSPSATTPTPIVTASSRRQRARAPTPTWPSRSTTSGPPARLVRRPRSARPSFRAP